MVGRVVVRWPAAAVSSSEFVLRLSARAFEISRALLSQQDASNERYYFPFPTGVSPEAVKTLSLGGAVLDKGFIRDLFPLVKIAA